MENQKQRALTLPGAVVIAGAIIAIAILFKVFPPPKQAGEANIKSSNVKAELYDAGHILPLKTEEAMLAELQEGGVIDGSKLPQVTELNLLWAYGLANKNKILEEGPLSDRRYGGPANLASVGGWTVSTGLPTDHMGRHVLSQLSPEQQLIVEKISKGIYRPCCNNSTYFPDCNHGMAMLGLLEYLASQGVTEEQMWDAALKANMAWFPDAYETMAQYTKMKGMSPDDLTPQMLLGSEYSSISGFSKISAQVPQQKKQSSGSCGVEETPAVPKQPSCGVN